MSEPKDDGGPAFPTTRWEKNPLDPRTSQMVEVRHPGATLRDYFAAKAMHAELVTAGALPEPAEALARAAADAGQTIEQRIAFNAYRLADAMLKERAKP